MDVIILSLYIFEILCKNMTQVKSPRLWKGLLPFFFSSLSSLCVVKKISNVVFPDDCPVELVPAKISPYEEGTTVSQ
jgi:hypothetical protein